MSRSDADSVLGRSRSGAAHCWKGPCLNVGRGAVGVRKWSVLGEEVFGRNRRLPEGAQAVRQGRSANSRALQHRAAQLYIDIEITRARGAEGRCRRSMPIWTTQAAVVSVAKAPRRPTTANGWAVQEGVPDAWRHGHDRPIRHRLLHEARGAGSCQELFGDF